MKGIVKGLVAAGLGLALIANVAAAQKPGLEFGTQLATFVSVKPDGGNSLSIFGLGAGWAMAQAPLGAPANVSVAYYLNEQIAIEPVLIFAHFKPEGSDATDLFGLTVSVPIYLKKGWGKAGGLFIAPSVGMGRLSSGGSSSSQNHFGVAAGTKLKVSDNIFWRIQGNFESGMENSDDAIPSYTSFGASFGLSAYLH